MWGSPPETVPGTRHAATRGNAGAFRAHMRPMQPGLLHSSVSGQRRLAAEGGGKISARCARPCARGAFEPPRAGQASAERGRMGLPWGDGCRAAWMPAQCGRRPWRRPGSVAARERRANTGDGRRPRRLPHWVSARAMRLPGNAGGPRPRDGILPALKRREGLPPGVGLLFARLPSGQAQRSSSAPAGQRILAQGRAARRYPGSVPPSARNPAGVASGTTDRTDRTDRTDGKRIPPCVGGRPRRRGEVPF